MSRQELKRQGVNQDFKKLFHLAGGILALAGVIFIVIRLHQDFAQLDFSRFVLASWPQIIILIVIYGAANLFLAIAWWHILGSLKARVHRIWAVKTYGISQLAKYIPGNIFQFAGRQALGLAANLPGWVLAKSIFWELILISAAGLLLTCLALPLLFPEISISAAFLLFLFLSIAASISFGFFLSTSIAKVLVYHLLFHLTAGLVFVGTLAVITGTISFEVEMLIMFVAIYVVAWLVGLVTFGAPAGIGVREVVLLFLLGTMVVESDLLLALVLNRAITVTGDGLFFIFASLLTLKEH